MPFQNTRFEICDVTAITSQRDWGWGWGWGSSEAQLQASEITNPLFPATVFPYPEASLQDATPSACQLGGLAFSFILIILNSMHAPPNLPVDMGLGKCINLNRINDTKIK